MGTVLQNLEMSAREFRALFERAMAFAGWPQDEVEHTQEVIRKDWAEGPGYPRDFEMPPAAERRRMWIGSMLQLLGEDVPVNRNINREIRASIAADKAVAA